jgi:hypothetical protein
MLLARGGRGAWQLEARSASLSVPNRYKLTLTITI